jgi:hypothetical protein
MNEQIEKIYDEACLGSALMLEAEFCEKFARLLILECARFLDERCSSDNCNNVFYPEPEELLKHFGVKK